MQQKEISLTLLRTIKPIIAPWVLIRGVFGHDLLSAAHSGGRQLLRAYVYDGDLLLNAERRQQINRVNRSDNAFPITGRQEAHRGARGLRAAPACVADGVGVEGKRLDGPASQLLGVLLHQGHQLALQTHQCAVDPLVAGVVQALQGLHSAEAMAVLLAVSEGVACSISMSTILVVTAKIDAQL